MQALRTPAFTSPRARPASAGWLLAAVAAGGVYAAAMLILGVALGVPRELYLAPYITSELAIVVETPLMIWACFLVAPAVARLFAVPDSTTARGLMALVALGLLLWAENEAAMAWRGRTLVEQWGLYGWLALGASVAGVAGFFLAPILRRRTP